MGVATGISIKEMEVGREKCDGKGFKYVNRFRRILGYSNFSCQTTNYACTLCFMSPFSYNMRGAFDSFLEPACWETDSQLLVVSPFGTIWVVKSVKGCG